MSEKVLEQAATEFEQAPPKKPKVTRAGPDAEPVTEMSLPDRALLVRGLAKHLDPFQINVSVPLSVLPSSCSDALSAKVELPCRQGKAPPLFEKAGNRLLRVFVDYRNVMALFPSIPLNMQLLLQEQLQKMGKSSVA